MVKEIIGDWTGTTFEDFLILPEGMTGPLHNPDNVKINVNIAGVELQKPFLVAAMRAVVGSEMALAAGKVGIMAVVPRGLDIPEAVEIVRSVKKAEIKPGEIETEYKPLTALEDKSLGDALAEYHTHGHSTIPILNRGAELVGMFVYRSDYDRIDKATPITKVMIPWQQDGSKVPFCRDSMSDNEIKEYLQKNKLRYVPVLDGMNRLKKLVFLQKEAAYKIGGAIDTHEGWEERAKALVEARIDMIFIDTSDAYSQWAIDVVKDYKKMFPNGPPMCAGNVVTADGFKALVEAGADAIKVGMGPGTICITNEVIGVGAPPYWALKTIADARDGYLEKTGKYVPIILDGGITKPSEINVALTTADAVMGGRLFAGFEESAGRLIIQQDGKKYKEYWGEGSRRAAATGDLSRYPLSENSSAIVQGVDALVPYEGRLKPGVEKYCAALRLAMNHTASENMKEYRANAKLIRLTENAKAKRGPHGLAAVVG